MYHRILLTNDGSSLAAASIPYLTALARSSDAEVLVLRVSHAAGESADSIDGATWSRAIDGHDTGVPLEAEPLLRDIVAKLRAQGVSRAGSLLLKGEPAETIVDAARRLEADLIVISSHGLSGLKRAVLGSVADHVARHVGHTPVLICHPLPVDVLDPLDRVVVSLDGSPFADVALSEAEAIARDAATCITLVRAIDSVPTVLAASMPVDTGSGVAFPAMAVEVAEEIVARSRGEAHEEIVAAATRLAMHGFPHVQLEILEEVPATAILTTARRVGSHLVVMSTHGRGGISRTLLGSVADEVVREFDGGAVLLVHPVGLD